MASRKGKLNAQAFAKARTEGQTLADAARAAGSEAVSDASACVVGVKLEKRPDVAELLAAGRSRVVEGVAATMRTVLARLQAGVKSEDWREVATVSKLLIDAMKDGVWGTAGVVDPPDPEEERRKEAALGSKADAFFAQHPRAPIVAVARAAFGHAIGEWREAPPGAAELAKLALESVDAGQLRADVIEWQRLTWPALALPAGPLADATGTGLPVREEPPEPEPPAEPPEPRRDTPEPAPPPASQEGRGAVPAAEPGPVEAHGTAAPAPFVGRVYGSPSPQGCCDSCGRKDRTAGAREGCRSCGLASRADRGRAYR